MVMANTLGALGASYYLVCYGVALVFPELYKAIASTWFHMLNLSSAWKTAPSGFVLGLVSFTVAAWVSGWLFAWLYNYFGSKK